LTRRGYGLGGYSAPEITMANHPDDYQAASGTSHSGVHSSEADFTAWLEYYSGQLTEAAEQAREAVLSWSKPAAVIEAVTPELPVILRDRQLKALLHIRENGAIRSGEYQRLVGIVPDTARRDFDELMDKRLIEVRGVGRGTHYMLTQRGIEEVQRRRPA
jgi:Fic family protein